MLLKHLDCFCRDVIRTVDALGVGDGAGGAQSVVILLVAHQRVHSKDGCNDRGNKSL